MLTEEMIPLLPRFVDDARGPSHDELTRIVERCNLTAGEPPQPREGLTPGKVMRVRSILSFAIDHAPKAGSQFVKIFIEHVRARGGFRETDPNYVGSQTIAALRQAFNNAGYALGADGVLRPLVLEGLEGAELTEALWLYVHRARTGADDAELVIGTSKNFEEAAVRHVLKECAGAYSTTGPDSHFPTALFRAFYALGLSGTDVHLDRDPYTALQQAIFLLACAVNRLRNDHGDGHGRPEPSVATFLEGRLSSESAALVTELLLTTLKSTNRG